MAGRPGGSGCATRHRVRASSLGVALAIGLLALSPTHAAEKGGGDRAAKQAAQRAIPWRVLNKEDRRAVERVVGDATLYRQLPTRVIDCDPELFGYLVDHPELVVDVWRVMGVSPPRARSEGPGPLPRDRRPRRRGRRARPAPGGRRRQAAPAAGDGGRLLPGARDARRDPRQQRPVAPRRSDPRRERPDLHHRRGSTRSCGSTAPPRSSSPARSSR